MKRDTEKLIEQMAPELRRQLAKIAADPATADALTREIQASIAEREAGYPREKQAIEQAKATEMVEDLLGKMSDVLRSVERKIEAIRRADEQRLVLQAVNHAAWKNGHLRFDKEKFEAALKEWRT
jgi:hypothetical protein